MNRNLYAPPLVVALSLAVGATDASAQSNVEEKLDTITVTGTRKAYQGDFEPFEIPQAELKIDAQTLRDSGSIDLVQALDLSASVSRQNNFGGLWNSFAIRGFVGDENLPVTFSLTGLTQAVGSVAHAIWLASSRLKF